jgi:DNA polymerase III subunit chi
MTEVLFYHLETQPLDRVLPVLIEKSLERDWHVIVETGSDERAEAIDNLLWTYKDDSFLPHALAGGDADHLQPVLITTKPHNPNEAEIRFFVDRAVPTDVAGYQRVVYMFSGHDPDAVSEARVAWKALKPGNELTYWQQDANGRWVKKA